MHNVFDLRRKIVEDYKNFSTSFSNIAASDISKKVNEEYENGRYWPDAMLQINPHYKRERSIEDLVSAGELHSDCAEIFRYRDHDKTTKPLTLYRHQIEAIAMAKEKKSFIVTTGTGSGKSLSFFIPIVDRLLRNKEQGFVGKTSAIVIYPMNALANSQMEELSKYHDLAPDSFSFARYTGQESEEERRAIAQNPPDILLTNYMMLELILTRYDTDLDRKIIDHCEGLNFLVLDELHTYRGRQGADVAMLTRRLRECLNASNLICIGTSATMRSQGQQKRRRANSLAFPSRQMR